MFKCTGICNICQKCQSESIISSTNSRKTEMISYPSDFIPASGKKGYGLAFDIGTTTVVGILRDLNDGTQKDAKAKTNPQNEFGMDVISRITFCNAAEQNFDILREKTQNVLHGIIEELCEDNSIDKNEIRHVVLCGNTTMSHIFAGYHPQSLARAPFDPAYTGPVRIKGKESLLEIDPEAEVLLLPGIAGHVGGDITSGILAVRLLSAEGLTLYIDIGTNGEIVITDGNKAYACSTAAGPAFEGASITFGMRASMGAIEKVEIDGGEVYFNTIGSCEPVGICGSGLIDIIAEMLKSGLIEKTGRLLSREKAIEKNIDPGLAERLCESDGVRQFIIVDKETGEDIVITQNDIREVQLAKGAIAAGIKILLDIMEKETNDIDEIIVAGAFGNYIDCDSAVAVGLLPDIGNDKIRFVGNAAGTGVAMAAANGGEKLIAENIPEALEHVELATYKDFQKIYMNCLGY